MWERIVFMIQNCIYAHFQNYTSSLKIARVDMSVLFHTVCDEVQIVYNFEFCGSLSMYVLCTLNIFM